jgi:LysM repeat protein
MTRPAVRLFLIVVILLAVLPLSAFAAGGTYTVKSGDTLARIARAHGVTVASIVAANGLASADHIVVGQKLIIPGGSSGSAPAPAPAAARYVVRSGDTLANIAARFGVSVNAITRANGITNPNLIYPGMKLTIPGAKGGGSAPAPAPAPATAGRASKFVVSISQARCWVYQGDKIVYEWVCSTGRRASPTKAGNFKVQSKIAKAYGSSWNIWMPYWLGIYWAGGTENGIHGMPWNATSGAKTWPGLVGTPITFGCVMLNDQQAKTLWNMAWIGMPVIVKR